MAAVLLFIAVANVVDLYDDIGHGAPRWHLYEEALVIAVSLLALSALLISSLRQRQQLLQLKQELAAQQQPIADPALQESRQQFSQTIQQQFEQWQLTNSEKEVGLLLLKGLSLKEIAAVRSTLEKTVRQQASSIYKKANVAGRHAFAAWFIEDFL